MTNKKYVVYYSENLNRYSHATVGWLEFVGMEYKRPILFTDDIDVLRKACEMLNKELKEGY